MSDYILIHIGIIIVPLIMSFERKLSFYKNLGALAGSILIVGIPFLIWDIHFARQGYWGFSSAHIAGFRILSLPIEEILFFVTVAYSCIFIYETAAYYVKEKQYRVNGVLLLTAAAVFIVSGFFFFEQPYTSTVSFTAALAVLLGGLVKPSPFGSRHFHLYLAGSFAGFLLVNYLLTSPPIVWYSDAAIWGQRVTTIPVEDFLYGFSLCTFWLISYLLIRGKLKFSIALFRMREQ